MGKRGLAPSGEDAIAAAEWDDFSAAPRAKGRRVGNANASEEESIGLLEEMAQLDKNLLVKAENSEAPQRQQMSDMALVGTPWEETRRSKRGADEEWGEEWWEDDWSGGRPRQGRGAWRIGSREDAAWWGDNAGGGRRKGKGKSKGKGKGNLAKRVSEALGEKTQPILGDQVNDDELEKRK